ncbi:MAG TPA: sugar kinase, partial [Paracoccaceae bacterium]
MKTFLGIGECMVELSDAGPGLWRQGFAGDVFNTLWYARAMLPADGPEHWQVRFFTAVGRDPISDQLIAFAEDAGITCADVPRIAGRVPGLYAIHLNEGERSFSYWRDTSAARLMMQDRSHLETVVAQADLIYFSGITLAILPPEDAAGLIRLLGDARRAGKLVAFDPNIRPRLWDSPDRMRATLLAGAGVADILLPGFDDEAMAFGDADPEATARRYAALG